MTCDRVCTTSTCGTSSQMRPASHRLNTVDSACIRVAVVTLRAAGPPRRRQQTVGAVPASPAGLDNPRLRKRRVPDHPSRTHRRLSVATGFAASLPLIASHPTGLYEISQVVKITYNQVIRRQASGRPTRLGDALRAPVAGQASLCSTARSARRRSPQDDSIPAAWHRVAAAGRVPETIGTGRNPGPAGLDYRPLRESF